MYILLIIGILLLPTSVIGQTVYFRADAESGTINPPWGGAQSLVTLSGNRAHSGKFSYRHEVTGYAQTGKVVVFPRSSSGMLQKFSETDTTAYYSVWYYIEQGYDDDVWKNAMQWKSDNGSGTIRGGVKILMGPVVVNGIRQWEFGMPDCNVSDGVFPQYQWKPGDPCKWRQLTSPKPIAKNKWFHIEVFFKATRRDAKAVVWQDGVEIFNVSHPDLDGLSVCGQDPNNPGQCSDNTHNYWGIGAYVGGASEPPLHVLYTDDAMITDYQVYRNPTNSPPIPAPSDLRIFAR